MLRDSLRAKKYQILVDLTGIILSELSSEGFSEGDFIEALAESVHIKNISPDAVALLEQAAAIIRQSENR